MGIDRINSQDYTYNLIKKGLKNCISKNCVHNLSVKIDIVPLIGKCFGVIHKTL